MNNEGFYGDKLLLQRFADLRYEGQSYELSVQVSPGKIKKEHLDSMEKSFHQRYAEVYGYSQEGEKVELVNLRLVAFGKLPELEHQGEGMAKGTAASFEVRQIYFDGGYLNTPAYHREVLLPGQRLNGPAVVEQMDSTTLIFPGQKAEIDAFGNIIIEVGSDVYDHQ